MSRLEHHYKKLGKSPYNIVHQYLYDGYVEGGRTFLEIGGPYDLRTACKHLYDDDEPLPFDFSEVYRVILEYLRLGFVELYTQVDCHNDTGVLYHSMKKIHWEGVFGVNPGSISNKDQIFLPRGHGRLFLSVTPLGYHALTTLESEGSAFEPMGYDALINAVNRLGYIYDDRTIWSRFLVSGAK